MIESATLNVILIIATIILIIFFRKDIIRQEKEHKQNINDYFNDTNNE